MSASSHMKRVGASVNVSTRSGQWIAGARLEHMATLASKVAASRLAPVLEVSTYYNRPAANVITAHLT